MSPIRDPLMGLLIVVAACQHVQPARAPSVSEGIFGSLCEVLVQEQELGLDQEVLVLADTRPVFHMVALHFHSSGPSLLPSEIEPDLEREDYLRASFQPQRSPRPPRTAACHWKVTQADLQDLLFTNKLILELSNVLEDPHAPGEIPSWGRFARFSLGGRPGASWLWIPLHAVDGQWIAGEAVLLDVSD